MRRYPYVPSCSSKMCRTIAASAAAAAAVADGRPARTTRRTPRSTPPARRTSAPPCSAASLGVARGLLRGDERVLLAHRNSFAKKAAAFPKNSRSSLSSRFSRSSSANRARSETVNGGLHHRVRRTVLLHPPPQCLRADTIVPRELRKRLRALHIKKR